MPKWAKWTALWVWVAGGVTFTVLTEYDDDYEERTVGSARMTMTARPAEGDEELAPGLRIAVEAEVADGGDLVRLVVEAGDVRGANPSGPEVEVVLEDRRDVYLRPLTDRPRLPRGKTWVQIGLDEVESLVPEFAGMLRFVEADGVLTSKPPLSDEHAAGAETIDGVETTRYELSADADELEGFPASLDGALVGDEVRMTTWIDGDGFIRRLVIPVDASYLAPRAGEGVVELHYEIYDLGADIPIELPDERDVLSG